MTKYTFKPIYVDMYVQKPQLSSQEHHNFSAMELFLVSSSEEILQCCLNSPNSKALKAIADFCTRVT